MDQKNLTATEIEELLKECSKEPIQFLGHIQNYACLLAIDISNFKIEVISENFSHWTAGVLMEPVFS